MLTADDMPDPIQNYNVCAVRHRQGVREVFGSSISSATARRSFADVLLPKLRPYFDKQYVATS